MARVFWSACSMGVPVKPMNDALGRASRRWRAAVDEVVLAAVRLVGNDDDVAAPAERLEPAALFLGEELLQGGEDDAAGLAGEQLAHLRAGLCLDRVLPQQLVAQREGGEELLVQVVAVREHHDGGVAHERLADDAPGIERHGERLARALRVPHDADALVAGVRLVALGVVGSGGGAQRLPDRALHGVVLVIAGDLLDGRARAVVFEHGEVADQVQQALRRAEVLDDRLEFGGASHFEPVGRVGVPRLKPLLARGEAAHARAHAVRDDQQGVGVEERGDLRLVRTELVIRAPHVGGAADGVLELEHHQRQAVDEQHHVGPAVDLALDHGELVDGQVVVVLGVVEVDDAHLSAANLTVGSAVLDGDAVDELPMRGAVAGNEVGALGAEKTLEGVLDGRCWEVGVEAGECRAEADVECGLCELGAFGTGLSGSD